MPQYTVEGTRFEPTYGASTLEQPIIILIAFVSLLAFVSLVVGLFALRKKSNTTSNKYFSKMKLSSQETDDEKKTDVNCLDIARELNYHAPR